MPNHENTIRRMKEQVALIECTDKPVKRTMIEFLQYYCHTYGLHVPDQRMAEAILEDYRLDMVHYEGDWVEPYRLKQLEMFDNGE